MIWGLLGLFVGANVGIAVMALLVAARCGDNSESGYPRKS
jgi:hypothetical protein